MKPNKTSQGRPMRDNRGGPPNWRSRRGGSFRNTNKNDNREPNYARGKLSAEYKRLLYVTEIRDLGKNLGNVRRSYEFLNSLDALIIDMANHIKSNPSISNDRVLADLPLGYNVWRQYKKRVNSKKMTDMSKEIRTKIREYLSDKSVYDVKIIFKRNTLIVKGYQQSKDNRRIIENRQFKINIPTKRLEALRRKGSDEEIAIMVLRYQCMVPRGNHWNIPLKFYKYIYEHEGVRLEGFSSPLNSQLMLIADDINFCSLFPDTDKVFGSVGSFFDISEPEAISFNPPYTEYIINEGIKKTLTWKDTKVIYNLPCWTDMEGYDLLDDMNTPKKYYGNGEFYYEENLRKIMFHGKHLMYCVNVSNPEGVFDSIRPTREMVEDFRKNGRLTSTEYVDLEETGESNECSHGTSEEIVDGVISESEQIVKRETA